MESHGNGLIGVSIKVVRRKILSQTVLKKKQYLIIKFGLKSDVSVMLLSQFQKLLQQISKQ